MPVLRALPLATGLALRDSLGDLVAMAAGAHCFLPVGDDPRAADRRLLESSLGVGSVVEDPQACLVIATSGSTGRPKGAIHTPATLAASADATHARLGGEGNWLLALPAHHIAGLQVLLRALRAGFTPVITDLRGGFNADRFAADIALLRGPRRYTSLVPPSSSPSWRHRRRLLQRPDSTPCSSVGRRPRGRCTTARAPRASRLSGPTG